MVIETFPVPGRFGKIQKRQKPPKLGTSDGEAGKIRPPAAPKSLLDECAAADGVMFPLCLRTLCDGCQRSGPAKRFIFKEEHMEL